MAEREDQKIELKRWGPEDSGKQIAKFSFEPKVINTQFKEELQTFNVNIEIAAIGEEGARYGYTRRFYRDKERHIFFPGDTEGFIAVAGLSARLYSGMNIEHDPPSLSAEGSLGLDYWEADSDKSLIEEPKELLAKLKTKLAESAMSELYPYLYYSLNAAIGHDNVQGKRKRQERASGGFEMIPDSELHETTGDQLNTASVMGNYLDSQYLADEKMENRLMELPLAQLPGKFHASRLYVADMEQVILRKEELFVVPNLVYLPVGFHPSGRSWPYMDASASHEKHFGYELNELSLGNVKPARKEIEREKEEIKHRLEYAKQGQNMLARLYKAEQEVA